MITKELEYTISRITALNNRMDRIVSNLRLIESAAQPFSDEVLNSDITEYSSKDRLLFELPYALECIGEDLDNLNAEHIDIRCMLMLILTDAVNKAENPH